jgi:hypothetical protein
MIVKTYYLDNFLHDMSLDCPSFTRQGAGLIFDFYESIGEPIEYDPIAFRCEWSEYKSPYDAMHDFFGIEYLDNERLEYFRLMASGTPRAEALSEVLGVPVLWDENAPDSYVVGV